LYGGYPLVCDFIARAESLSGDILTYCREHRKRMPRYNDEGIIRSLWALYFAKMKQEVVTLIKLLKRKQRMFMIQCKELVCLHKEFFSKQSKRLRMFNEIKHGQTWFYGYVDQFAKILDQSERVDSEDDEFFDKYIAVMEDIYTGIRVRCLRLSVELSPEDDELMQDVVYNLINIMLILPTGDIIQVKSRLNPSGADATTENNCLIRKTYEFYMCVLHFRSIDKPINASKLLLPKKGTAYLGDDRAAGSADYEPGYLDFYKEHIHLVGIKLKTLVATRGAEGAEFAGFTIQRSHWNRDVYVPHYKLEKLWYGFYVEKDSDFDVTCSRFMAFALLTYPHYEQYKMLKPVVISFLQQYPIQSPASSMAIQFWSDEEFLRRSWMGYETNNIADEVIRFLQWTEEGYCF